MKPSPAQIKLLTVRGIDPAKHNRESSAALIENLITMKTQTIPPAVGAHTPTPYFTQAVVEATNILAGSGRADSTALVATVNHGWGTGPETAAFIIRACNSHAALVGALEKAVQYLDAHRPKGNIRDIYHDLNEHENGVLGPARAALANAKGEART